MKRIGCAWWSMKLTQDIFYLHLPVCTVLHCRAPRVLHNGVPASCIEMKKQWFILGSVGKHWDIRSKMLQNRRRKLSYLVNYSCFCFFEPLVKCKHRLAFGATTLHLTAVLWLYTLTRSLTEFCERLQDTGLSSSCQFVTSRHYYKMTSGDTSRLQGPCGSVYTVSDGNHFEVNNIHRNLIRLGFTWTAPLLWGLKISIATSRKTRFGMSNVPDFSKSYKIWHFWQCTRTFWHSARWEKTSVGAGQPSRGN